MSLPRFRDDRVPHQCRHGSIVEKVKRRTLHTFVEHVLPPNEIVIVSTLER
jgi:hypothetical protein